MSKQLILEQINENSGLISSIGNKNNNPGELKTYSEVPEVIYCNILSAMFFRTETPPSGNPGAVYTSIIHRDQDLYFSFQKDAWNTKNPAGLNSTQVGRLADALKSFVNDKEHILDLLIITQQNKNNIVAAHIAKYPQKLLLNTSNDFIKALEHLKNLALDVLSDSDKNTFYTSEKNYLLQNQNFIDYISNNIFKILIENIQNIKTFLDNKTLNVVPYIYGGNDNNHGVHVEVKGLYEARTKDLNTNEVFNVGLATCKPNHRIGCCTGCSLEFVSLIQIHNTLTINRTADYHTNFPPRNYQVSHNTKDNIFILRKFSELLLQRCESMDFTELGLESNLRNFQIAFNKLNVECKNLLSDNIEKLQDNINKITDFYKKKFTTEIQQQNSQEGRDFATKKSKKSKLARKSDLAEEEVNKLNKEIKQCNETQKELLKEIEVLDIQSIICDLHTTTIKYAQNCVQIQYMEDQGRGASSKNKKSSSSINQVSPTLINKLKKEQEDLSKQIKDCESRLNTVVSMANNTWVDVVLHGLGEQAEGIQIGISPSYIKYTLSTIQYILDLRINDLHLKKIKILPSIFIDQNNSNITDVLLQIFNATEAKKYLVPLNLFNKHAAGLIFEIYENNKVHAIYFDPLNKYIPQELKQIIIENYPADLVFNQLEVEYQKYSNCGAEVVEDFIYYLTNNRATQEQAAIVHSQLIENALPLQHELLGVTDWH